MVRKRGRASRGLFSKKRTSNLVERRLESLRRRRGTVGPYIVLGCDRLLFDPLPASQSVIVMTPTSLDA